MKERNNEERFSLTNILKWERKYTAGLFTHNHYGIIHIAFEVSLNVCKLCDKIEMHCLVNRRHWGRKIGITTFSIHHGFSVAFSREIPCENANFLGSYCHYALFSSVTKTCIIPVPPVQRINKRKNYSGE